MKKLLKCDKGVNPSEYKGVVSATSSSSFDLIGIVPEQGEFCASGAVPFKLG
jgi:hypothetical protein